MRMGGHCLYPAFLPLIGVPPGEVIWIQIKLKITISKKSIDQKWFKKVIDGRRGKTVKKKS